jgi:hypothetical protein
MDCSLSNQAALGAEVGWSVVTPDMSVPNMPALPTPPMYPLDPLKPARFSQQDQP